MEKGYSIEQVAQAAMNIRKQIMKLASERGGCYLSQACSSAEILATLYMRILHIGESNGNMQAIPFPGVPTPENMNYQRGSLYHGAITPENDRFFVSPAHYASVVYCALKECGRISAEAIEKFNIDGWNMEMIGAEHSPGFENTAGSLGQTISIAAGTAHARKLKKESGKVYLFLSDGEIQEGQVWEALAAATFYKLDNLVIYIDLNKQQVEGYTKDVFDIDPLEAKFAAFGCKVSCIDGHDIMALEEASKQKHEGSPLVVICNTNTAQGIPLLERKKPFLHFVKFEDNEIDEARSFYKKLCSITD